VSIQYTVQYYTQRELRERAKVSHVLSYTRRIAKRAHRKHLHRSTCLSKAETAKLNEMRVELIYNQFTPDSMRREEMHEIKVKCEDSPKKQDEINFKTALSILEAEGNEEVARSRAARAARGKLKKAGRLIGRVLG